jgi:hypothetical protein
MLANQKGRLGIHLLVWLGRKDTQKNKNDMEGGTDTLE